VGDRSEEVGWAIELEPGSAVAPPDPQLLDRVEAFYRIAIPPAFREWMRRANGGVPRKRHFIHKGVGYEIERFCCRVSDSKEHPLGIFDIAVVLTTFEALMCRPDDATCYVLPMARLTYGDYVCMNLFESPPRIVLWKSDESTEFNAVFEPLARDIPEFIGMLTE
jgi:hypothetical protein